MSNSWIQTQVCLTHAISGPSPWRADYLASPSAPLLSTRLTFLFGLSNVPGSVQAGKGLTGSDPEDTGQGGAGGGSDVDKKNVRSAGILKDQQSS